MTVQMMESPSQEAPPPGSPRKLSPRAKMRREQKVRPVFYTHAGSKTVPVALWGSDGSKEGQPEFDGEIDGRPVLLWKRVSEKTGKFLAIFDAKMGPDERYVRIGSANVVVNARGMIRLAIRINGRPEPIWASVTKSATIERLAEYGLRPERIEQRKSAFEAQKASSASQTV